MSCNSPVNTSDETHLDNFYSELFYFVHSIPKHSVLITVGDMIAQRGKNVNNKFRWHIS